MSGLRRSPPSEGPVSGVEPKVASGASSPPAVEARRDRRADATMDRLRVERGAFQLGGGGVCWVVRDSASDDFGVVCVGDAPAIGRLHEHPGHDIPVLGIVAPVGCADRPPRSHLSSRSRPRSERAGASRPRSAAGAAASSSLPQCIRVEPRTAPIIRCERASTRTEDTNGRLKQARKRCRWPLRVCNQRACDRVRSFFA